jgi:hypothetical protein
MAVTKRITAKSNDIDFKFFLMWKKGKDMIWSHIDNKKYSYPATRF